MVGIQKLHPLQESVDLGDDLEELGGQRGCVLFEGRNYLSDSALRKGLRFNDELDQLPQILNEGAQNIVAIPVSISFYISVHVIHL